MSQINDYIAGWLSHRNALIALLDTVTDDQVSYTPWEGAMSFGKLVTHIVDSTDMFAKIVRDEAPNKGAEAEAFTSVGELKNYVQAKTEATKSTLASITDEQLSKIVTFSTMQMPGMAMLQMAKEHEIHHKGQLFTYARIIGVKELPFFVSRP